MISGKVLSAILFAVIWVNQPVAARLAESAPAQGEAPRPVQKDCPDKPFDPGPLLQSDEDADKPIPLEVIRCTTFESFQWAIVSESGTALERISVAFAQGSDPLGNIERERRDLAARLSALERRRDDALALPDTDPARSTMLESIGEEIRKSAGKLESLTAQIQQDFPSYGELAQPRALSVREARELMKPNEVVVQILVNEDATYLWAVSHDRIDWIRVPELKLELMQAKVGEFRESLTVPAVRGRGNKTAAGTGQTNNRESGDNITDSRPFDPTLAYGLYRLLFGPLEPVLGENTTLLVVGTGPITGIPLAALVTQQPGPGDYTAPENLAGLKWMADKHTIVTLPTLSSLRALRCFGRASDSSTRPAACPRLPPSSVKSLRAKGTRLAFFGVGAPKLEGAPLEAGWRSPVPGISKLADEDRQIDLERLRALAELPGSLLELTRISEVFNQRSRGSAQLLLAEKATEPAVRESLALRSARYVSFATHGLLTGEAGASEPGLVLTPPEAATPDDDGFLAASNAARLNLSAEFVVLSACNTATNDGTIGAEGLVGLGPAFFYAGARSLLVSHWTVDDSATAYLMQATFGNLDAQLTGDQKPGRAAAFANAMKEMRTLGSSQTVDRSAWVHPAFWAAFSFVGEPVD